MKNAYKVVQQIQYGLVLRFQHNQMQYKDKICLEKSLESILTILMIHDVPVKTEFTFLFLVFPICQYTGTILSIHVLV